MTPRRHRHVSRGGSAPLRHAFLPLLAIRLFFNSFPSRLPSRAVRRRVAARSGHVLQSLCLRQRYARNVYQVDSRSGHLRRSNIHLHEPFRLLPFASDLTQRRNCLRSLRLARRHRSMIPPSSFCEPAGWTLGAFVACARLAASLEDLRVAEVAGVAAKGCQIRGAVADDRGHAALGSAVEGLLKLFIRSIVVDGLLLQGQVVVGLERRRR